MKVKKIISLIAAGLFFSCDPGSQIRYSVVNKTSSELHLNVNPPSGVGLGGSYDLKPNDEVTIYADEALGYAADIIEHKPMKSDFLKCLAVTKDSMPLKIDINNSSVWTPENIGDTIAMYRLIITSDVTK